MKPSLQHFCVLVGYASTEVVVGVGSRKKVVGSGGAVNLALASAVVVGRSRPARNLSSSQLPGET